MPRTPKNATAAVIVLHTDGSNVAAFPRIAALFADLYPILGCDMIELVRTSNPALVLLVDEDGLSRRSPINVAASVLAGRPIVGAAALVASSDVR